MLPRCHRQCRGIREYYTSVPSGTSEYLRSVYHESTFSAHMSPRLSSAHCAGERVRCKALRSRSNTIIESIDHCAQLCSFAAITMRAAYEPRSVFGAGPRRVPPTRRFLGWCGPACLLSEPPRRRAPTVPRNTRGTLRAQAPVLTSACPLYQDTCMFPSSGVLPSCTGEPQAIPSQTVSEACTMLRRKPTFPNVQPGSS